MERDNDKEKEIQALKEKIARLEKTNKVMINRLENEFSVGEGAFSLFVKNSALQSDVEKKSLQLNEQAEQINKDRRSIDEALLISETDSRGNIIYANQNFIDLSGYSKEEIIGQNHRIVNSSKHSKEFWTDFWMTLKSKKPFKGEICNRNKNGDLYWVETTVYPNLDSNGNTISYTSIRIDVTEKKRQEAKNQHAQKLAAIGELAASVAHEINNPLAVALGSISILKKQLSKEPIELTLSLKTVGNIETALNKIKNIAIGLRIQSRANNDKDEDVLIWDSTKQTVDFLKHLFKSEGAELSLNHFSGPDFYVKANNGKFQQILTNLLSNAKDATEGKNERKITVTVSEKFSSKGSEVQIEVADNGTGIPEALREKILEPFYTTKPEGKGTGLGLGIVTNYINQFKGRLEIESEENIGSKFKVILPFDRRQAF